MTKVHGLGNGFMVRIFMPAGTANHVYLRELLNVVT